MKKPAVYALVAFVVFLTALICEVLVNQDLFWMTLLAWGLFLSVLCFFYFNLKDQGLIIERKFSGIPTLVSIILMDYFGGKYLIYLERRFVLYDIALMMLAIMLSATIFIKVSKRADV